MILDTKYNVMQRVIIRDIDSPGLIIKLEVQPGIVMYNVQYWLNGDQKFAWLTEQDLQEI